ncbi:hypothetical protein GR927_11715 [Mycolicibacterium sp. 3033]|nr:hypothetical protein [Mycolicibacterium aurantiacum]
MHTSIGKPLVALVSAACLSAPAAVPSLQYQLVPEESHVAVALSAATTPLTPAPVDAATVDAALESMAALSGIDKSTLVLQLLTAPYHNVLAVANATGAALQSAGMFAALPFSIATLVLANQTDQIPAYVQTVRTNLQNAIPGIRTAISTELAYDADLFAQLFGGNAGATAVMSSALAGAHVDAVSDTPISRLTLLAQLLTAPYHNVLAVANATGSAIESFGMFLALPVSVATLVLANQTDQIPAYVSKVQTNLQNALPGIKSAIAKEVAYDKSLVSQVFGGPTTTAAATALTSNALHAPNLLTGRITPELPAAAPAASPTRAGGSDTAAMDVKKPTWSQKLADKVVEKKSTRAQHSDEKDSSPAGPVEATNTPSDTKSDASSDTTTKSSTRTTDKSSSKGSPAGGKHRKPDAA